MAIKFGNMVVKSKEEPKKAPSKPITTTPSNIKVNKLVIKNEPPPEPKKPEIKVPEKYIVKEEGELITKLNTKSPYMRDIFDLDQN